MANVRIHLLDQVIELVHSYPRDGQRRLCWWRQRCESLVAWMGFNILRCGIFGWHWGCFVHFFSWNKPEVLFSSTNLLLQILNRYWRRGQLTGATIKVTCKKVFDQSWLWWELFNVQVRALEQKRSSEQERITYLGSLRLWLFIEDCCGIVAIENIRLFIML